MIKGLTRAGIGNVGDFQNFVKLASQYGFAAVDAAGSELEALIADKGQEGASGWLKEQGVQVGTIGLAPEWRSTEEQFRSGLIRLTQDAAAAAALGCTTCCTYVLPSTDYNAAHFMALATRRMRICAQILGAYGIRLGLEFVGPHHLRTAWKHPFIWDLDSTLDWIEAIGEPNVGLLFDAYHWYTNEHTLEDIYKLKASQIVHVHINDAADLPIPEVLDNARVYPGEGVIDLGGFLGALKQIGYQGVISQEILTREPSDEPAEVLLKRSQDGFNKVYSLAGLN
ncbi:sugar phosphate isomerase/epimerase family protein [Paenibacillus eucommiae]|uniref:Sugar phosphate isomerase/epimerase n=1 Tax=Paenibacillus eucommiae TaxID=1355755 RepID=A0ABS4IQF2_9BACL|nr:sugar phosphate isomerase/epimerase family protein [Paenibacillus eucommiae]MBP1989221.1 sugar phosphate isomerase/epimerase [Paenibacillus eucommiae]